MRVSRWPMVVCRCAALTCQLALFVSFETFGDVRITRVQPAAGSRTVGFTEIPAAHTAITFSNQLDDGAVLRNQNLMLGSGVAAGDFDGDGWCDLYFCAVAGRNALYRNAGGWKFEDVTVSAGAALPGHASTGCVFADIDGDRDLDLLVSSLGRGVTLLRNEGNATFRDATREAGLLSRAGSMTMTLGDIEGDGDLDLFVCNYGAQAILKTGVELQVRLINGKQTIVGPHAERLRIANGKLMELGEPPALYLNDATGRFSVATWNTSRFIDEEGRPVEAPWDFGLSAQMRDVNGDGAPDIYVCNDFDTPDRFWINDGRGNFRLIPKLAQRAQSYASMGVDFADVDRDGHLDFFVVEMLATERARRLWQMTTHNPMLPPPGSIDDRPEITRNTFFRARGDGTFEEMANYAGVAPSDWSWQGVFLDVDLDGFEDLLVANGHLFDVQDADVPPARSRRTEDLHAQLLASPRLFTPKRAWRNRGDLRFEDRSAAWRFNDTNICHGLALADLDNDGDLDFVGNRMNASAWLLRNDSTASRVAVRLKGKAPNTRGIGAKVAFRGGTGQTQEIIAGGKYLSGDDTLRAFAAGNGASNSQVLEVIWRSGARSAVSSVPPNSIVEVSETETAKPLPTMASSGWLPLFHDVSERLQHVHTEPSFDDFQLQPLLMKKLSQRGPGLCVTDLDGDGHEDVLIGSGRGGRISFYRGDGRGGLALAAQSVPVPDDVVALVEWTAADGARGALASLANYETTATNLPLLFLALDKNELVFETITDTSMHLPPRTAAHVISVADFDADGDLDVFLGGHALAGRYPEAAPSWLLRNDGATLRVDESNSVVLADVGLVNSGIWTDLDADGWPDLVVACEWGPIRIFKNSRGRLGNWDPSLFNLPSGLGDLTGWWSGIAAADFDGDGRMDFVAGNWGLNGPQRATAEHPLIIYYGDCLARGHVDLFETEYDGPSREPMPARMLSDVARWMPPLHQRFATHRAWAACSIRQALAPYRVRTASVTTLASTVFLNRGDRFEARSLPREAQLSPCWSVNAADFDADGHVDLFLGQNFFALRSDHARLDAGRGLLLRGNGRGDFVAFDGAKSGLGIYGEQRGVVTGDFDEDGRVDLLVSQNGAATKYFRNSAAPEGVRVRLAGPRGNPRGLGAVVQFGSGTRSHAVREIHGGAGWMSHDSATVVFAPLNRSNAEIQVRWPGGRLTRTAVERGIREVIVRSPAN